MGNVNTRRLAPAGTNIHNSQDCSSYRKLKHIYADRIGFTHLVIQNRYLSWPWLGFEAAKFAYMCLWASWHRAEHTLQTPPTLTTALSPPVTFWFPHGTEVMSYWPPHRNPCLSVFFSYLRGRGVWGSSLWGEDIYWEAGMRYGECGGIGLYL